MSSGKASLCVWQTEATARTPPTDTSSGYGWAFSPVSYSVPSPAWFSLPLPLSGACSSHGFARGSDELAAMANLLEQHEIPEARILLAATLSTFLYLRLVLHPNSLPCCSILAPHPVVQSWNLPSICTLFF